MDVSVANAMAWSELKQLVIEEYCPFEGIQKLEQELWDLVIKEVDIVAYTNCLNNLSTLCPRMVTPEYKKVEIHIWGLPRPIQDLVTALNANMYDDVKRLAFILMNQEIYHNTMV